MINTTKKDWSDDSEITIFFQKGNYGEFSNFMIHNPFTYNGYTFTNVEVPYQLSKFTNFNEAVLLFEKWAEKPYHQITPSESKKLGRKFELRNGWDESVKYYVMEELIFLKMIHNRRIVRN